MDKNALMYAAMPDPPTTITPQIKSEWNKFLDFINRRGLRGNKDLDKKDMNLGRSVVEEFKKLNPDTPLSYDIIKPIQESAAQDWELTKKIQALKSVKSKNVDDRPLSPPDGWLGSMTSNMYFPVATTSDPTGKIIKNWGHDLNGYYQSLLAEETKKIPAPVEYANNKK